MNGLFHTLSHASPLDIHKSNPSQASPLDIHNSNLHLPCTVPGTNLLIVPKRGLEDPQHITVSVQEVLQEDDRDVGLGVDTKAQLCPATTPCDIFSGHTEPVNRKVQPVETWRFEPTSPEESGCAYSTDLNVGTPWWDFTTAVSQYVDKAVGSTHRLWARLQTVGQDPGNGPWDLEEGGGLGREPQPGPVETLDITSPLSYIPTHLATCLTNPVTTSLSPSAELSPAKICVVSHHTSKICEPHHMIALRMRRKNAKAGTLLSITRDLNRPPCHFIHCSCTQCQTSVRTVTHGNLGLDGQWWGVDAPGAGSTMIQQVIGTLRGQLILNYSVIWLVLMCLKSVTHSSPHPSTVRHILS